ncbi:hypothetical protein [Vibrio navarrensis]|uniref:hypothetical protein n=1 Tax=Vibrio navarrensis TaxID=29495 RepID=UPI0018DEB760|nr:hypothetical protein [Vibrio navarrensis]MBH9739903.1 hypothetical protein [Vibrio navarrensis]
MEGNERKFVETYSLHKKNADSELCKVIFEVRQYNSSADNHYKTEVTTRIRYGYSSLSLGTYVFENFRESHRRIHISDLILPTCLRGNRIAVFVFNRMFGYLSDEVKRVPQIFTGRLVAQDKASNRDHFYKRLIGYDTAHPLAKFNVDDEGEGAFEGQFVDIGESWKLSLDAVIVPNESN